MHALVNTHDPASEAWSEVARENGPEYGEAVIDNAITDLFARDGKNTGTVYSCRDSDGQDLRGFFVPLDTFPSRIVLYEMDDSSIRPLLERGAVQSIPLEKNPEWVWEQYRKAQRMDSGYERDLVVDEIYRRYCNELAKSPERKRHGLETLLFHVWRAGRH